MNNIDEFKLLVGGYFGITEMDEYDLKVYVLKEIEEYIKNFLKNNPISNLDYKSIALEIQDKLPLKRKLQDSILTLHKIDGPLDLTLLVKKRLRELDSEEN